MALSKYGVNASHDITGSIEVGKYADLVVLEEDPTSVEPSSIASIKVSQTMLGGRTCLHA